jgi:hypothetical protein
MDPLSERGAASAAGAMRRPACIFCGHWPVDWHHLTGRRSTDGEYLDPRLVVPLCRRHHAREHTLLRDKHLEFPPDGADLLGHRLRRVVVFAERCGDFGRPFQLEPASAQALARLVTEAVSVIAAEGRERRIA